VSLLRVLLLACPREFRERFGAEMVDFIRSSRGDGGPNVRCPAG